MNYNTYDMQIKKRIYEEKKKREPGQLSEDARLENLEENIEEHLEEEPGQKIQIEKKRLKDIEEETKILIIDPKREYEKIVEEIRRCNQEKAEGEKRKEIDLFYID